MRPYYVMLARLLSLDTRVVIAHRGGARLHAENTLPAFVAAARLGVDAVECDVRLSADGQPVVIHDETVDRTTDAVGEVASRSAAALAALDATCRVSTNTGAADARHGGVPLLAEVLEAIGPLAAVVEIKGTDVRTAERALDVVREMRALDRVLVGGFSHAVLEWVRRLPDRTATSASRPEVQSALRRSWFRLEPRRSGYDVFQVPVRLNGRTILTERLVRSARRGGVPVHAWIVDEPDEMRTLLDWGVTGLISDRPDLAMSVARTRV